MIQFYNDGYRPSLGNNGKHPHALGQRADECWPEIWHIIYPLITTVRTKGESFFFEDQLVPIYRNGHIEDVYWTFSYSPILGEHGKVDGVLVVCHETTKKVLTQKEIEVTKRKLEQSENNLLNLFKEAPAIMAILRGPNHVYELANSKYKQLIGTGRDIIGLPIREALPEIDTEFYTLLDKVYATGKPFNGQEVSVMLDRHGKGELEEVFLNFVYQPAFSDDGEINGILVHAVDVTAQVVARKAVEESEKRYATLIKESDFAIALYYGRELKIQYVNEIMTGYWGKDLSVVGKCFKDAVPELEGQPFLDLLDHVFTSGETYVGKEEMAMLRVNGMIRPFYFNYTYKALRDLQDQVYAIHHTAIDVTDQVLSKKKIEQSEINLRNIILKAPVAMCILLGPEYVVSVANELMIELWGKPADQVLHKPIFEGLPDARNQGLEELLAQVYGNAETFHANERPVVLYRNNKFETVYQNFVYEPHRDNEGNVIGVLAISIDVTQQVIARQKIEEVVAERTEQLEVANKDLQRSNAELAQFAYIASHDLQEPARKISTFTEMLRKSLPSVDARSEKYIDKIEGSAARMLILIRDVLTLSQISSAAKQFSLINLNTVFKNITSDFELLIEEKNARVESNTLPTIEAIPIQITQLFSNLISNSLKFCKDSNPVIKISARQLPASEKIKNPSLNDDLDYYDLSFADNGIGFSQENALQIFDIFQRLHGRMEYEGTGIGLAICKKITQNHRGDIYAESTPGNGATFHVILPARQAP
jgi:signal transduction histidine kinase